jgi:hypothetical protein
VNNKKEELVGVSRNIRNNSMEVNKFEQFQEFGLEYLTFGGPCMNTVKDEPKVKWMFTKST